MPFKGNHHLLPNNFELSKKLFEDIKDKSEPLKNIMMMMMMMMMMINCYCGMIDRQKAFSLMSSRDLCQKSSQSRISYAPRAGSEPVQNLRSGFAE